MYGFFVLSLFFVVGGMLFFAVGGKVGAVFMTVNVYINGNHVVPSRGITALLM